MMQYIPATILWILALIKLPHARDTLSRHVFWAAIFAALGCTLYAPSIYIAVDTALGGRNAAKLAAMLAVMLGFWQFRSAILVAVSTDTQLLERRLMMGRCAIAITGVSAIVGFALSNPGSTSTNLQLAYSDEPGLKVFLISGSAFLVWAGWDLMLICLNALRHLHSAAFRLGFLLIALGCAASCLAISARVLYGSISRGPKPTTEFTAVLDSAYWTLEALAVLCIGVGLILPSLRRPANAVYRNLQARSLLIQLRPAWQRATAAHHEIVLNHSAFEFFIPARPHAMMLLHRRFIEIRDGEMRSGQTVVVLPEDSALLDRAESLLRGH